MCRHFITLTTPLSQADGETLLNDIFTYPFSLHCKPQMRQMQPLELQDMWEELSINIDKQARLIKI